MSSERITAAKDPRERVVRFSPQRQAMEASARRKLMLLLTATMLIGVGAFFAVEQAASGDGPSWAERFTDLGMLPFGAVLAGIAITLGLVYRVPRAHVYALLILAVFFAGQLMTNETPWRSGPVVLVACGAIVLIGGAIQLWRFSREFGPRTPGGLDA